MTAAEKLYQLIQTFSETQINEVLHFAEFLDYRQDATASTEHHGAATQRANAIQTMRGLLKTSQPAPTDEDVATMLAERRMEKHCQ